MTLDCLPDDPESAIADMNGRKWNDEERKQLEELWKEGYTINEIASMLGRTPKSVAAHHYYHRPDYTPRTTPFSEKEIEWLKEHFKHTKNADLCKRFGVCQNTIIRRARLLGLKKSKQFMRKTQAEAAAKAKESHLANGTYPPKGYVIPNRNCFKPGKGRGVWERVSKKKAAEMKKKAAQTWRKTWDTDRRRVIFGMEQKTRFNYGCQSRKKLMFRYNLRRKGYLEDPADHNLFRYTSETRRSPAMESYAPELNVKIRPFNQEP